MKFYAVALLALVPCFGAMPGDVDKDKILGDPAAQVQLELYSDFMCPACKAFHEQLLPVIMKDYVTPGKVCIISREFPLNIPAHKYSRQAANLATAAARVHKYPQVSDLLFAKQQDWGNTGKMWEAIASAFTPAEQKKVQALANDPNVTGEVQRDYDSAMALRVSQTPTLIIRRGTRNYTFGGPGQDNYMLLKSLIDGLLK
jgi:protein-disulfide isomerase